MVGFLRHGNNPCAQVLKANPLMEVERNLFVHFFTAPDKLSRIVGELAQRVDALATAQAP